MLFRSITLFTTMSLLSTVVSTTAHAGENPAESDVAAATATLPGAVLAPMPPRRPAPKAGSGRVVGEVLAGVGVGAGLAVGAGLLAYTSYEDSGDDGWESLGNAFAGVVIGGAVYPLGVGLGGHGGEPR